MTLREQYQAEMKLKKQEIEEAKQLLKDYKKETNTAAKNQEAILAKEAKEAKRQWKKGYEEECKKRKQEAKTANKQQKQEFRLMVEQSKNHLKTNQ